MREDERRGSPEMVVRASRMEVPAARFDEGGGGKVQKLLVSMEVL